MAHRSRLGGFIIDCKIDDLDDAARFWSAALGLDVGETTEEGSAEYVMLDGSDLHIEVQKVAHASRVHLDIEADDIDAEAMRLEQLGAKRIGFVKRWWVMEAPTGQRFCVVRMLYPDRGVPAKSWD
ncbi:MAG: VOC family protein [Lysobacterales bacterium]